MNQSSSDAAAASFSGPATLGTLLRSHPKFKDWSPATLDRLEAAAMRCERKSGSVLHHAGTPAREVYFLAQGVVETLTELSSGEEHCMAFWHPGVVLGMPALFLADGTPRRQSWIAHTDVTCWRVPITLVRACFWEDRGMAESIVAGLGMRVLWLTEELANATLLQAQCKVLAKLLKLYDPEGVAGDGPMHPIRMTQAKLAAILGLTRQSVGRVLKELEVRELVRVSRFRIEAQSMERLRAYALECGAARLSGTARRRHPS